MKCTNSANWRMDADMQLTINSFRQLFPFLTFFPWLLVKSLTFPWQLSDSRFSIQVDDHLARNICTADICRQQATCCSIMTLVFGMIDSVDMEVVCLEVWLEGRNCTALMQHCTDAARGPLQQVWCTHWWHDAPAYILWVRVRLLTGETSGHLWSGWPNSAATAQPHSHQHYCAAGLIWPVPDKYALATNERPNLHKPTLWNGALQTCSRLLPKFYVLVCGQKCRLKDKTLWICVVKVEVRPSAALSTVNYNNRYYY